MSHFEIAVNDVEIFVTYVLTFVSIVVAVVAVIDINHLSVVSDLEPAVTAVDNPLTDVEHAVFAAAVDDDF